MAKSPKINPLVAQHDAMVASILAWHDKGTEQIIIAGATWYPLGLDICRELAATYGCTLEQAVAVVAQLSPRTRWAPNIAYAAALLAGKDRPAGCMGRNWEDAKRAFAADDPIAAITGEKRISFAANFLGDDQAVTVDTWALRVAGLFTDEEQRPFGNVGGYEAVAEAYRAAAGMRGISPMAMQAITWCVIRGGAA
jgi:hypothetical protein